MPALQHALPHGVVPDGQQHVVAGSEQVSFFAQHPVPQTGAPAGHPHWPVLAFRHASPAAQQFGPHGVWPAWQEA
jgi:hypothetical protein